VKLPAFSERSSSRALDMALGALSAPSSGAALNPYDVKIEICRR